MSENQIFLFLLKNNKTDEGKLEFSENALLLYWKCLKTKYSFFLLKNNKTDKLKTKIKPGIHVCHCTLRQEDIMHKV